jgi:hypothetical protein
MEDEILNHIQNPLFNNFFEEVERIRLKDKADYMEAILGFCERNDIEIEVAANYINTNVLMKAKIQEEAEQLHYLEKTARLPI